MRRSRLGPENYANDIVGKLVLGVNTILGLINEVANVDGARGWVEKVTRSQFLWSGKGSHRGDW